MKSISVIGCGWFGFPLSSELVQSGMRVVGTKRSSASFHSLTEKGIEPVELDLSKLINLEFESYQHLAEKFQTDYLLINIPPRVRSGNQRYLDELNCLIKLLDMEKYEKVIFISSTGVYPHLDKVMTESDASARANGNELLFNAERLFTKYRNSIILRFSGLIGPGRHPGRFFADKNEVAGGDAPVNLVHLDDCVNSVKAVLSAEVRFKIYNLCTAHHPEKAGFYTSAIQSTGGTAPAFLNNAPVKKQVDGSLITRETGFTYVYSDLNEALKFC